MRQMRRALHPHSNRALENETEAARAHQWSRAESEALWFNEERQVIG